MQFNPAIIEMKERCLDEPLRRPEFVKSVVAQHVPGLIELVSLPRTWEPGGGASLYRVRTSGEDLFLKVKHESCLIESRLESESKWSAVASLANEYQFLSGQSTDSVPRVHFFAEQDGFQFLGMEWLEPFHETTAAMNAPDLYRVWCDIQGTIRNLFDQGIVHTDIHENNICFRGVKPVVCDFEEARLIAQDVPFEASLDVVGRTELGDVGEYPSSADAIAGLTCLNRLEEVFRVMIVERLSAYLSECKFDHECPFNLDSEQAPDERNYQSVSTKGLVVSGQRPMEDCRHLIVRYFMSRLARETKTVSHLDIGSNLGVFCLLAARQRFVRESVGLEAFDRYVECSRCLAFIEQMEKVRFFRCVCGDDSLSEIVRSVDFVTMLSVYHHVSSKAALLEGLRKLQPKRVLAEFAVQERYYPERKDLSVEIEYIRSELGVEYAHLLGYSPDYQRPLILFSSEPLSRADRVFLRVVKSRFRSAALTIVRFWELCANLRCR